MSRYRAVIFDLDGTLVESAPDLHAAAARLLEERGHEPLPLATVRGFVGQGVPRLVERLLRAVGEEPDEAALAAAIDRFRAIYGADPARLSHPNRGAREALGALAARGLALGVCTNKPEEISRRLLAALGLDRHLGAVVGGDTTEALKPDPAPVRLVLERLGAAPAEALYVGDSETDEETARRAGLDFALFTGGYRRRPVEAFEARLVFDDFAALVDAIEAGRN